MWITKLAALIRGREYTINILSVIYWWLIDNRIPFYAFFLILLPLINDDLTDYVIQQTMYFCHVMPVDSFAIPIENIFG